MSIDCKMILSILSMVRPTITINGVKQEGASWREMNTYDLPPGQYHIRVSRPWGALMPIDTCVAETVINLRDQEMVTLKYKLPIFIFLPGTITMVSQIINPEIPASRPAPSTTVSSGLELCPTCKNPNPNNAKVCEWCGNQMN